MTLRAIEILGRRVTYVDVGPPRDPPLVCLHGAGFDHAGLTWGPTTAALRRDRRVVVPNLPGYGGSEPLAGRPDLAGLGAWTGAFLDALHVGSADVAGLSLGGGMALWLAIHEPEKVQRLVAVCPFGVMARAPLHPLVFGAFQAGALSAAYRAASRSRALARLGLALNYGDPSRVTREVVGDLVAVAKCQSGRRSFEAFLEAEMGPHGFRTDLRADLGRITAPTLMVSGRSDRLVPARHVRTACDRIKECRHVSLPTGHWPMRERPEEFGRALRDFLSVGRPARP